MKKDNAWRVYDVIIEGVSLVKTYRTQFQDILQNGNADALIQRVNQKVKELQGA
jgi:phospholipid transport system substrate-binding protein